MKAASIRRSSLAAAVLLALSAAAVSATPGLSGPLRVDNAYPPILPFLVLPAEAPQGIGPGKLVLTGAATYGNTFHWDPSVLYTDLDVLIDAEVLKLSLAADYGLLPGLAVGASLSLAGAWGGFLDPLIQGFHGLFGLPNADRERYPDNRFAIRVVRSGVAMTDLDRPFWALCDLALAAKWTLLPGTEGGPGVALQAALSLPTGSVGRFTSDGALDAALGVLASWRRGPFAAYSGLRYLYFGAPVGEPVLGFRPHNLSFFLGLEWAPSGKAAWLAQIDGASLPYTHPHRWFGTISGSTTVGARFRLGERLVLQVHVSEEFWSFAAQDIVAGAVLRFDG